MGTIAQRLLPGNDLKRELQRIVLESHIRAGVLLSVVGSLSLATIRTAGSEHVAVLEGPLEIVSGTGTFSGDGTMHIHISVADSSGLVKGGHLMPGSTILTTAEIVIGDLSSEMHFTREMDQATGYLEFVVKPAEAV